MMVFASSDICAPVYVEFNKQGESLTIAKLGTTGDFTANKSLQFNLVNNTIWLYGSKGQSNFGCSVLYGNNYYLHQTCLDNMFLYDEHLARDIVFSTTRTLVTLTAYFFITGLEYSLVPNLSQIESARELVYQDKQFQTYLQACEVDKNNKIVTENKQKEIERKNSALELAADLKKLQQQATFWAKKVWLFREDLSYADFTNCGVVIDKKESEFNIQLENKEQTQVWINIQYLYPKYNLEGYLYPKCENGANVYKQNGVWIESN